jgi:hypothetical protein
MEGVKEEVERAVGKEEASAGREVRVAMEGVRVAAVRVVAMGQSESRPHMHSRAALVRGTPIDKSHTRWVPLQRKKRSSPPDQSPSSSQSH